MICRDCGTTMEAKKRDTGGEIPDGKDRNDMAPVGTIWKCPKCGAEALYRDG